MLFCASRCFQLSLPAFPDHWSCLLELMGVTQNLGNSRLDKADLDCLVGFKGCSRINTSHISQNLSLHLAKHSRNYPYVPGAWECNLFQERPKQSVYRSVSVISSLCGDISVIFFLISHWLHLQSWHMDGGVAPPKKRHWATLCSNHELSLSLSFRTLWHHFSNVG